MGQKVNPIANRLGIIRGWDSNWYGGKDFSDKLVEDAKIRKYLNVRLAKASISKIIIERTLKLVTVTISTARPGIIIGKGGQEVDKLKEELKKLTGKEGFKGINPDECVAVGAAIQGGVLQGDVKGLLLLDVTPLSLGIETLGGVCTKIIERNTTIPTHKSQVFSTAADNQPSVEINVLQGEREFARDNKSLGVFHLDGIAPAPRGVPQIEVTFDIDANGIVKVSAKDLGTGKEQNITITASTNMSKDDIDKAVKEAEQFAAEDKKRKEEVDVRNEADQMVYQIEKSMTDFGDKVTEDDKAKVQPKLDALKGTDIEAIKTAKDELQKEFYEVAGKIYQAQGAAAGAAEGAAPQQDNGPVDGEVIDE